MAARTLLLKLERRGLIELPARRRPSTNHLRNRVPPEEVPDGKPIRSSLSDLRPLAATLVEPGSDDLRLFNGLLSSHHYLGHRNTVGENLRYLVRDRHMRPVACLLFGSACLCVYARRQAAWKCADRDSFLGWGRPARERNLQRLTNNTRIHSLERQVEDLTNRLDQSDRRVRHLEEQLAN